MLGLVFDYYLYFTKHKNLILNNFIYIFIYNQDKSSNYNYVYNF